MKKAEDLKNYRTKYKRYYDIDFDKDYAIHHIDGNRDNNDIGNLLLLPRSLHNKFHMCFNGVLLELNGDFSMEKVIKLRSYSITSLLHLAEAMDEIEKWVKWKQYNYDEYLGELIFSKKSRTGAKKNGK